jgi:pentatricopeptide repeat protein
VFEEGLRSGLRFDVVGWNCLVSAYTEYGMLKEAQATLERMIAAGVRPDAVTYIVLLSCAAKIKSIAATKRIHQQLSSHSSMISDNVVIGALVHSYAQCGDLDAAVSVFEAGLESGLRFSVEGWNVLLSAFAEHGMVNEAQATVERMTAAGVQPDAVTYVVLLSCAAKMKSLTATKRIHQQLSSHSSAQSDNVVIGALVHSYAQCGDLNTAVSAFEAGLKSGLRFSVEEWNVLLSAYKEHGMMNEAQATLERMIAAGVQPNVVTYTTMLSCAAGMKSLGWTKRIHQHLNCHPTANRDIIAIAARLRRVCGAFAARLRRVCGAFYHCVPNM